MLPTRTLNCGLPSYSSCVSSPEINTFVPFLMLPENASAALPHKLHRYQTLPASFPNPFLTPTLKLRTLLSRVSRNSASLPTLPEIVINCIGVSFYRPRAVRYVSRIAWYSWRSLSSIARRRITARMILVS